MKITITGSLGHISKPLAATLVQQGHAVTVISSSAARKNDIEAMGASAASGSLFDLDFLVGAFTGADAVYTMVPPPPGGYFDLELDLMAYWLSVGNNYVKAIQQAGVKRVVNLSTIGGHLEKGSGILLGAHNVEKLLNELPPDVAITHMRPTSFFYNLYAYVHTIKNQGVIATNYGADQKIPWVSPIDIAGAIAEEIVNRAANRHVRYVASEELTGDETAGILGAAIGKPGLKWILISSEQMLNEMVSIGMNPTIATGLVEMYESLYTGLLSEDYYRNKPAVMGNVKLKDFAKEFAATYNQQ